MSFFKKCIFPKQLNWPITEGAKKTEVCSFISKDLRTTQTDLLFLLDVNFFLQQSNCLTFTVSTSPAFAASNNCRSASELPKGTPSVEEELNPYQVLHISKYKIKKVPLIVSFRIEKYQFKCNLRQVALFSKRLVSNHKCQSQTDSHLSVQISYKMTNWNN